MIAAVSRRFVTPDFVLSGQASRLGIRVCSSLLVILALLTPAVAAEKANDAQALAVIFGDEHTANVLELRRQAARESGTRRHQLLLRAVLPPRTDLIRVDIEFSPTHPSPPVASDLSFALLMLAELPC